MAASTASAPPSDGTEPSVLEMFRSFEAVLREGLAANPLESLTAVVGIASAVFYWAEVGANPGVATFWDAFHYISTSVSVGHAKTFPVTSLGKAISGWVMMVGPALSSRALDAPGPDRVEAIAAKLDAVLVELRRIGSSQ